MAFSTIQGSGGAPDSFVGTSGVDAITFIGSQTIFELTAEGSDDSLTFIETSDSAQVISNGTLKGGDGDDFFSDTILGSGAIYNNVLLNGNAGDDLFELDGLFQGSRFLGGMGEDEIVLEGDLVSTLVNGNKEDDTIEILANVDRSNIFGGQGDDEILIADDNAPPIVANSVIAGDLGDDIVVVKGYVEDSNILGGDGSDAISIEGTYEDVLINGNAGDDVIITVGSLMVSEGVDIFGGDGNDSINAISSYAALALSGDKGNDNIVGGDSDDTITGGSGTADTIQFNNGQVCWQGSLRQWR